MNEGNFEDGEAIAEVLQIFADAPEFVDDTEDSHLIITDVTINVANWTPEDFSRVYVRYRPTLVRYAYKFLKDPTEIDEVIQDAFLYLFLSLPELDSEIGILKFLKWKTRLLSFDLIRVSGRRPLSVIDDPEWTELDGETTDGPESMLDRMHDAAIVHAALARISDRHREVLIRSEFKEETTVEIGSTLGLSENATRQLVHRARRTFRLALIEIVEQNGHSVSETLSVAVKKAKEQARIAGALILLLVVTTFLVGGSGDKNSDFITQPTVDEEVIDTPDGNNESDGGETPAPEQTQDNEDKEVVKAAPLTEIKSETSTVVQASSIGDIANFEKSNATTKSLSESSTYLEMKIESAETVMLVTADLESSAREFKVQIVSSTGEPSDATVVDLEQSVDDLGQTQITMLVFSKVTDSQPVDLSDFWLVSFKLDSNFALEPSAVLITQ